MALTAAEIQQLAQVFAREMKTVFDGSNFDGSSDANQRQRSSTLNQAEKNQAKFHQDVMKDISSIEKNLPKHIANSFAKSGSAFINTVGEGLNNMTDVIAAERKIENMSHVQDLLTSFRDGNIQMNEMNEMIRELGYSGQELVDMMGSVNNTMADENGLIKQNVYAYATVNNHLDQLAKEASEASKRLGDVSRMASRQSAFTKSLIPTLTALGKGLLETTRAAAKFGTTIQILDAFAAGMSPEALSKLQSDHRQSILALGGSYKDYNQMLHDNRETMIRFTGDLGDATRATADMITTSRLLGDANVDSAEFVKNQTTTFGRFNRVLGTTWEQFSDLNKTLSMDSELRGNLIRMDKTRRVQAFQEIQHNYEKYRLDGLLHEQAIALTKTMEGMAGMTAKSRIQKGARISAIAGTVGMGAEGERIRALMGKGTRATGTEKAELAGLLTDLNKVIGQQIGSSNARALGLETLIEKGDVGKFLGPGSDFTNAALAQGAAAKKGAAEQLANSKIFGDNLSFIEKHWTKGLVIWDTLLAFMQGPFYAAIIAMGIKGAVGGISLGSGGAASTAGKAFGGAAAKIFGPAAALGIGYSVGTFINDQLISDDIKTSVYDGFESVGNAFDKYFGAPKKDEKTAAADQLAELRRANGISENFLEEQKKTNQKLSKTEEIIKQASDQADENAQDAAKQQRTIEKQVTNFNPNAPSSATY